MDFGVLAIAVSGIIGAFSVGYVRVLKGRSDAKIAEVKATSDAKIDEMKIEAEIQLRDTEERRKYVDAAVNEIKGKVSKLETDHQACEARALACERGRIADQERIRQLELSVAGVKA